MEDRVFLNGLVKTRALHTCVYSVCIGELLNLAICIHLLTNIFVRFSVCGMSVAAAG